MPNEIKTQETAYIQVKLEKVKVNLDREDGGAYRAEC